MWRDVIHLVFDCLQKDEIQKIALVLTVGFNVDYFTFQRFVICFSCKMLF